MCVDHLTFFINPPESGVGAAVFQAGVLPFIHIYNVPVISGDGHGEQDEAEQPAQTRTDDNCPKVHFHHIKSLLWFIEFERLLLPFSSSEARRVSFEHIKAHHSVFITPVVSRVKEESALSTCWMKNSGIFLGIISPAQLYLEWEQILWTLNPHDSLSSVSAAITHCGSFALLRDELVSSPSCVNTLLCI